VDFDATDQLWIRFLAYQILEKKMGVLYQLFIHFKKTYDSVGGFTAKYSHRV
jgi:hypothetical protein